MMAETVRVILIEDSALMRILISELLRKDDMIDLIATAANGKEGIEKVRQLKPDVVVTDMIMPEYDGLYVVQELASSNPVPVILLSSLERDNDQIFEALQAGAFDFIDKPRDRSHHGDAGQGLTRLIKESVRSKRGWQSSLKNSGKHTFVADLPYDVVLIGSSTGGPGAVEYLLDNLPENFAIPVVVAQHMPERFIETFAERLNKKSPFKVAIAVEGESPIPGHVYLAGGQKNLQLTNSNKGITFTYTDEMFKEFNFPSIDCLFSSAAASMGRRTMAIVLTGMGKDGALGVVAVKQAGGYTIAQDESSSAVYGMPKAAKESGAIDSVMNLKDIPGFVVSSLS